MLKTCPQCGYRYNAPENQTCGKCKGWLGATPAPAAVAVAATRRGTLIPRNPRELLCYLPVLVGLMFGFPNPFGAAFGLLMAALMLRVVRLDMEQFSKGLLLGIVAAAILFAYLVFLLLFGVIYNLLEPIIQPTLGRFFKG
jgi:hypothetical protein